MRRSRSTSFQYIIAHWQYGKGYCTQTLLTNSGTATATVKVQFFNSSGSQLRSALSWKRAQEQ
jgi:hypothetical protein